MEDKGRYDVLLTKYLANELNAEDELFIQNWVNVNNENRQNFETLKNTWELLGITESWNNVDVDAEWLSLKSSLKSEEAKVIALPQRQITQASVASETIRKSKGVRQILIGISVAASLIFMLVLGNKVFFTNASQVHETAKKELAESATINQMRHELNNTDNPIPFKLDDGSAIVLFSHSEIRFRKDFPKDRRNIILYGKAQFKIAHDKSRPFTVFTGDIKTTALGTNFTVTAFQNRNRIVVRLDEGKVLVKPVDSSTPAFIKDVVLLPGQELTYDKKRKTVEVKLVSGQKKKSVNKITTPEVNKNNPTIPNNYRGSWFMFNNQPLSKILESLQEMYDTKIIYSEKDLEKFYFIGRFNRTDSLEGILNHIADLNGLTITKTDSTFILKSK